MKQTAVEWYAEQAMNLEIQKASGNISITKMLNELTNILNKAKEMEKEQMERIYYGHNQYNDEHLDFEQYYKETFKQEEQ